MGDMVVYDILTLNGVAYQVDSYHLNTYNYQTGWTLEEIDNAFQMDLDDGGVNQPPNAYNVCLDQVSLTGY